MIIAKWWTTLKTNIKNYNFHWKRKCFILIPLITVLIGIDAGSKQLAIHYLIFNQNYRFIPGFLGWHRIINSGIAFGAPLNLAAAIAIAIILILITFTCAWCVSSVLLNVIFTIIGCGAAGNLIDRMWNHGRVVDFIAWELFPPYTIFNLADIMVTCGAVALGITLVLQLIISSVKEARSRKKILDETYSQRQQRLNKKDVHTNDRK